MSRSQLEKHSLSSFARNENGSWVESADEVNLPDFLVAPWHVREDEEDRDTDVLKRPGERKSAFATLPPSLNSVWQDRYEIIAMAKRMVEERSLFEWGIEVNPLCVPKFGSWGDPPTRRLRDGEVFVHRRYEDTKIVLGVHPDLSRIDYEKGISRQLTNILTSIWAKNMGVRLLGRYKLREWKLMVNRELRKDTWGMCFPTRKEIYLDPFKLSRARSSIRETILHEIAHALAWPSGPNGHGPKWQKKARELGVAEQDIAWHAKFGS